MIRARDIAVTILLGLLVIGILTIAAFMLEFK